MQNELSPEELEGLSPNIRETVVFLRKNGFDTSDSGDGTNHANGMECALPTPHVFMPVPVKEMVSEADRLLGILSFVKKLPEDFGIEVSYSPLDGVAMLMLFGVTDKDLS